MGALKKYKKCLFLVYWVIKATKKMFFENIKIWKCPSNIISQLDKTSVHSKLNYVLIAVHFDILTIWLKIFQFNIHWTALYSLGIKKN